MIRRTTSGSVLALLILLSLASASPATAAGPSLKVTSLIPDHVTPGKGMVIYVAAQNTGDQPLSGDLTVKYTFPAGVVPADPYDFFTNDVPPCQAIGQVRECVIDVTGLQSGSQIRYRTDTEVEATASGILSGQIEVSGAGLPGTVTEPLSLDTGPIGPFAIESLDVAMTDAPAFPSTQAGSDPGELRTSVSLPSEAETNLISPQGLVIAPSESFRDVIAHLPPGFIGNPTATPLRCTATELVTPIPDTSIPICPPESQVGLVQLNGGDIVPLWNLKPPLGYPAALGFYYLTLPVTLLAEVRPSDHGVDLISEKTSTSAPITKFEVTAWGVPGDSSHDQLRELCLDRGAGYNPIHGDCSLETPRVPFLRTPTSCPGTELRWGLEMDTYQHPGSFVGKEDTTPAIEGCEQLPFDPSLSLAPENRSAHAPTGLDVNLTIPQNSDPDGLAESDLRQATVTLPEGVGVNPASADGLQACNDAQLGLGQAGLVLSGGIQARLGGDHDAAARPPDRRLCLPALAGFRQPRVRRPLPLGDRAALRPRRPRDQASRLARRQQADRPAHDHLRQPAAAAVRIDATALQDRPAGAAGDSQRLRHLCHPR